MAVDYQALDNFSSSPLFTEGEREEFAQLMTQLANQVGDSMDEATLQHALAAMQRAAESQTLVRDVFGHNPLLLDVRTAIVVSDEMGMKRAAILAVLLHAAVRVGVIDIPTVEKQFGTDVARIIEGLVNISRLYEKNPTIESENFRNLLLSFAGDMRVILIMIAERTCLMRQLSALPDENREACEEFRRKVAGEAAYLYAPLSHKLGLYRIKSELEDLAMKYTETEVYYQIKDKLSQTKAARDKYIADFIEPVSRKVAAAGLKCHIKGRTKSIHSIWQKMKKQRCPFEGVYNLFAIRIIIDSPPEREKPDCWLAYSIVTDMYQPNPNRLRDWLSIPKSNGYESLHTTVMGPEGRWVEVQIRTERMDDIAERGLAAHWRYKGVQSETGLDEWLTSIREALENADDDRELMDRFKMDLYKDDVFVFTPQGDLFKLPHGATVLDFAYSIHTNLGYHCTGAKVNNRHVPIRYVLHNGDQVEILSSNSQTPKQGWLSIVTTSRARSKVRQALKEIEARQASIGREEIERRFKNRKIELDEGIMLRLIRKMGYKQQEQVFYQHVADGKLTADEIIEGYNALWDYEHGIASEGGEETASAHSAAEYRQKTDVEAQGTAVSEDAAGGILFIDPHMAGVEYKLAKCCNPIYGDDIFGFVTVSDGIKIHRQSCPNATDLRSRFSYRIVPARWSGKAGGKFYAVTLSVVGLDDLGIINNLTSILSKDEHVKLRNININTHDKLFSSQLTILMDDTSRLNALIKKLREVKGVKQVQRL